MPIDRVVVLGSGLGGWLAASLIARALPDIHVGLVESTGDTDRSLGIASHAETLLPGDLEMLARFGIDEDMLVRAARGSFALGTALTGWREGHAASFVPFGELGAPMGPTAFHQIVARARSEGAAVNLANYALGALYAQSDRFARPGAEDRSVHATLDYGLHIETAALALWLRSDALAHGVELVAATATDDADLIIDASGPNSAYAGPFESWAHYFPCDRAVSALRPVTAPPQLYAHVEAHDAGWQAFVPVQGAIGETFVYAHDWLPDGPPADAFEPGRQQAAWRQNTVAVGGAATLLDPLAGTQLHLAIADVARLIDLFPNDRNCTAEANEYNRQWREKTDCAFDYALLRTVRCDRKTAPFWADLRRRPVPDRLAYRIALFECCGRTVLYDGESFDDAQWIASFDALGVRPRRYDALAEGIDMDRITAHLARIRDAMLAAVGTMPPYPVYLDRVMR